MDQLAGPDKLQGILPTLFGREDRHKSITGVIGDKPSTGINEAYQRAEDLIQDDRQAFGAPRPFPHESFGEGREAGQIHKHDKCVDLTPGFSFEVTVLNKMWG